MKNLILIFFITISIQGKAQVQGMPKESFMRWGAIDLKDLTMNIYPADSNANAVVLGSFCYTYFNYYEGRFQVTYNIHKRIKILKKDGYNWANIEVPLYSTARGESKENVMNIRGATYNLNISSGAIERTFLEEKNIFRETLRQHKGRTLELVKFALPNIREGAVIEYSYSLDSDFITMLNAWEFQSVIPVRKSEFQIRIIDELSYIYVLQNNEPFTVSPDGKNKTADQNGGTNLYRWVQENIPAFKDENFIATADDYIGKIQFQLASYQFPSSPKKEIFSTWENTIAELWGEQSYGGFIKRKGATKDLVGSLIVGKNTENEKMAAIYNYVKGNFKAENRTGIWAESSPKEVVEKKRGSKHEINLLLINMLREADLEANPILLSTRTHGRVYKNYPILERFNYSIAYVKIGEQEFLLDATSPMFPMGMLPANVLNGEGLLMDRDGKESKWISLQNRYKSSKMWIGRFNLNENGALDGNIEINLQGYEALSVRQKYVKQQNENGGEVDETQDQKQEENEYDLFKDSLENLSDYEKPLKAKGNYQNSQFAEAGSNRIYFNPLLDLKMKENPFKATTRKTLIDFAYPYEESFLLTFFIPDNYQVEELPKSERILWNDKSIRFDYLVSVNGNAIQVVCKVFVNRSIFASEEYANLRDTFAKIVAKQNEQIVLKKK